ncbi:hypothetical protein [Ferdinandcohnia sp. SAFN-114]|uniref:hypothetical protein n=1 Tax=Ferdinandcohnia sp. SAFN-114 TaxID=3387275 RepID=UPI003F7F8088
MVDAESFCFYPVRVNSEWWYFRLNTRTFEPSGVYEDLNLDEEVVSDIFKTKVESEVEWQMSYYGEEVLEIEPGEYVDRSFWGINQLGYDEDGDPIPLPRTARIVTRKYNGGSYVVFPKF